jgi:hypothetical protein
MEHRHNFDLILLHGFWSLQYRQDLVLEAEI